MTAGAFEFDSTGGSAPDASAKYADPYGLYDKGDKADESEAPNGNKILKGLQLNMSGGGKSAVDVPAMGWTNPQPGRLTR